MGDRDTMSALNHKLIEGEIKPSYYTVYFTFDVTRYQIFFLKSIFK